MRRLTTSLALAAVVSLGGAVGVAQAQEYPPQPPSWTPPFNLAVGGQVSFDSNGFAPGSYVDFSLVNGEGDTLMKLRLEADENGQVQYDFDANFGGMFAAVAQGQNAAGEQVQASKVINVVEPAQPADADDASSDVVADHAVVVEDAAPVDASAPAVEGSASDVVSGTSGEAVTAGNTAAPQKTVAPISSGSGDVVSANSAMPVTKAAVSAGTAQVVQAGGTAQAGAQLAKTGTDTLAPMVWAGAGLLAFGAGLVGITVVRRRSNQLT